MGAIRKTLSVTTLGIIPFRSKKEKLHRAESAAQVAELEVRKEHEARLDADRRVSAAERRAREAELRLLNETKKAAARRPRRFGRKAPPTRTERMSKAVHDFVEQSEPVIEDAARRGGRRARIAAKRASKEAKHAAKVAKVEGAKVVDDVRERAHELTNR